MQTDSTELDELAGAELVYGLFYKYAEVLSKAYGVIGLTYPRLKQLMADMDLMEGVPAGHVDAYVREHVQRADLDGNGVISAPDFVIWLLTEVAALVPIRDAFCAVTGLRPLYNQYHAVLLGDVGFTDGARKPATGVLSWAFLKMAEQFGVSTSSEAARQAFKAARASFGAGRGASGSNTGAGSADGGAGGGRLQFAAFVRALGLLATRKMSSLDLALYSVVACGEPPPPAGPDSRLRRAPLPLGVSDLGLGSLLEGPAVKERYRCTNCGKTHARYRLEDWLKLEEHLRSVGVPHPVRRYMPALPLLNARNLRATFHRYCAAFNRGRMPPASYRLPGAAVPAAANSASRGGGGGGGCNNDWDSSDDWRRGSGDGDGGGAGAHQPGAYGACCCLFRSLSVMELPAWLRLCGDCDTIRASISHPGSGLTPAKLEAAFAAAASIGGAYLSDDSAGIHDIPITGAAAGGGGGGDSGGLSLQRNRLGAVAAGGEGGERAPKRSSAAYQQANSEPPRLHEVRGPASAAAWLANARSLPSSASAASGGAAANTNPYLSGAAGAAAAAAARPGAQQHRSARLVLTFPQFLEALRLVAEEAGGHPTTTPLVEQYLLRICCDVAAEGCPRPDPTTQAGTATLRRMIAVGGGAGPSSTGDGSSSVGGGHEDEDEDEASHYSSLPLSRHRQDAEEMSCVTSASTSTKFTYDDFTPPDSDLYTSASSSRASAVRRQQHQQQSQQQQQQRRAAGSSVASASTAAAAVAGEAQKPRAPVNRTASTSSAATTSTKYTYDDFTPPDSDLYTSASSSRVPSTAGSSRRREPAPAPVPVLPAPQAAASSARASERARSSREVLRDSDDFEADHSVPVEPPAKAAPSSASRRPPPPPQQQQQQHGVARPQAHAAAAQSHQALRQGTAQTAAAAAAAVAEDEDMPPPPSAWAKPPPPKPRPSAPVRDRGSSPGRTTQQPASARPRSAPRPQVSTGGASSPAAAAAAEEEAQSEPPLPPPPSAKVRAPLPQPATARPLSAPRVRPQHPDNGSGGGPKLAFGRALPKPEPPPPPPAPRPPPIDPAKAKEPAKRPQQHPPPAQTKPRREGVEARAREGPQATTPQHQPLPGHGAPQKHEAHNSPDSAKSSPPVVPRLNLASLSSGASSAKDLSKQASTGGGAASARKDSARAQTPTRNTSSGGGAGGESARAAPGRERSAASAASASPRPVGLASPMRSRRVSNSSGGAAPAAAAAAAAAAAGTGAGGGGGGGGGGGSRSTTPVQRRPSEASGGGGVDTHGTPSRRASDAGGSVAGAGRPPQTPPPASARSIGSGGGGRSTPPPPPPPPMPSLSPGECLAAARAAAAAVDPKDGDGGSARSLVRCGSGLRNTMLLLARDPSADGGLEPGLPAPPPPVPPPPPPPLSREASSAVSELMQPYANGSGSGGGGGGGGSGTSRQSGGGDWARPPPPSPPDPRSASPSWGGAAAVAEAAAPSAGATAAATPRRLSSSGAVGRPPLPPTAVIMTQGLGDRGGVLQPSASARLRTPETPEPAPLDHVVLGEPTPPAAVGASRYGGSSSRGTSPSRVSAPATGLGAGGSGGGLAGRGFMAPVNATEDEEDGSPTRAVERAEASTTRLGAGSPVAGGAAALSRGNSFGGGSSSARAGTGAGAAARESSPRHQRSIGRERPPPGSYEGAVIGANQYFFNT